MAIALRLPDTILVMLIAFIAAYLARLATAT